MAKIKWIGPRVLLRLHRRGFGFDEVSWAEFAVGVSAERPEHLSIDVFDTCLVRDLAGDQPIERAINHRLTKTVVGGGGVADRSPDPSSDDIAEELERELCRPVSGAVSALRAVRSVVPNITFVSDTDRSSEFLISMLRWHGMFEDGDRLFASCEMDATKSEGDLFSRVWGKSHRSKVWHLGNSIWADGVMAASAGLRPFHIAEADLNRYEAKMAELEQGEGPAIAGAARLARLDIEAEARNGKLSPIQADAQTLGADVAGQALVGFGLWLADQVQQENITNLGFLARDGELPMRLAQLLPADHWPGVSMAYIHCSRMVWSLASASAVGVDEWLGGRTTDENAFLEAHRHDVPLTALLARIGITKDDLIALGAGGRQLLDVPDRQPLPVEAVDAWHELLADERVGELILERSDHRRLLLIDYVRGEGLLEGPLGLVDVGWRGRLAWHISKVLGSGGADQLIHFHFGGTKIIPEVDAEVDIRRFAFDGSQSDFFTSSPVSCVETLTASGKARVIDYRRTETGDVEPVLGVVGFENDGDRADLWTGAARTATHMPSRKKLNEWGVEPVTLGTHVRELLALWWNKPSKSEVRAIANVTFEHDEAGTAFCQVATPYAWRELGRKTPTIRAWRQGSEILTPIPMRQLVRAGRLARSKFNNP